MNERQPLIRVRNLKKDYPRQRVDASLFARLLGRAWGWTGALDEWAPLNEGLPVLKGIDLDIYPDETLAIVGKSGAGKSTLLHLIGALDKPTFGSVLYQGRDLSLYTSGALDRWRNQTVGFVFQFYHLFPDLNAVENVLLPAMVGHSTLEYRRRRTEFVRRAEELLDLVGLADRRHHQPSQLSGGEQQRVAIARALILEPKLLLCDEPTGNLDQATGEKVLEILRTLKRATGQTYVIVTHDENLTEVWADRVVVIAEGLVETVRAASRTPTATEAPPASGRFGVDSDPTT